VIGKSTISAAAAAVLLAWAGASSRPSRAADSPSKTYSPVAPERDYYKLKHLMGDGMMPNYKALWSAFRQNDVANMKQSLDYMTALARDIDRYPPPAKEGAGGGTPEDFKTRMGDLEKKASALSIELPRLADRTSVSGRILSIYGTCQSCHDIYAPEEGKDRRKYSPPPG
jgi:hypothetical protein